MYKGKDVQYVGDFPDIHCVGIEAIHCTVCDEWKHEDQFTKNHVNRAIQNAVLDIARRKEWQRSATTNPNYVLSEDIKCAECSWKNQPGKNITEADNDDDMRWCVLL